LAFDVHLFHFVDIEAQTDRRRLSLATLIRSNAESIFGEWKIAVRAAIVATRALGDAALVVHLPRILEHIAEIAEGAEGFSSRSAPPTTMRHALERLDRATRSAMSTDRCSMPSTSLSAFAAVAVSANASLGDVIFSIAQAGRNGHGPCGSAVATTTAASPPRTARRNRSRLSARRAAGSSRR
jgi:hypothetical protein